jgi:hypothetical protein
MIPSARTVELGVMVAGVVLPAWPIWYIRRRYIAIPVSALLSCWLTMTLAGFTAELNPGYDSFGAGITFFFAPGIGIGCANVLAAIHVAIRRGRPMARRRNRSIAGLAVWSVLCLFSVVIPFIAPPRARQGDPSFLIDYFFYCGPFLLLALTMSLVYLWPFVFSARGPVVSVGGAEIIEEEDTP